MMEDFDKIHGIQSDLNEQEIFFYYSGYVTEDLLLSAGKMVKKKLDLVKVDKKISRAIFAIFVEEVQNIIRYSKGVLSAVENDLETQQEADELRHGFVLIGKTNDRYYVCCGNIVYNEDAVRIERSLKEIQNLDSAGLKLKYKEAIKKPAPQGSKGAGLGLIDIARRASGGFSFEFKPHDDLHKYFYLKAYA
ncbi:conserved hypothetical protein [Candidatus Terasakiella magnetica]|uniref:Uncharacterized protein n=1 Tax=Candidatus Terasakiella magnetica TaxID=1867952 RepID=A0A1C3RDN6_9PROT|nr:SiaB family protein kinase [Candidatus Terasakiella magnetica]SCA55324.1 conserved hypothetical protein [Candidatus Terasakiella magnetica]